jgi:hypothetical protein
MGRKQRERGFGHFINTFIAPIDHIRCSTPHHHRISPSVHSPAWLLVGLRSAARSHPQVRHVGREGSINDRFPARVAKGGCAAVEDGERRERRGVGGEGRGGEGTRFCSQG